MSNPNIGTREVDNPHTTYAQTLHDEHRGVERPGKIVVPVNLRTMYGGFARFEGTELQNETVRRFKNIFESAQIGGARACDPAIERVDGGGVRQDATTIIGADARHQYSQVKQVLGDADLRRLEFVVIGENGPTAYAKWRSGSPKPSAKMISKLKLELVIIVLKLAHHWKLAKSVGGRHKGASWSDGTEAVAPSALDERS